MNVTNAIIAMFLHGISLYAQELYHAHNSELLTCWHKSCCIYECGFDSFCKFSLQ
jgi:hypothetical protein